jgi:predicted O-methyltransferase YrrM
MRLISANLEMARALREEIRQACLLGHVEGSDGRCYEIFPDSVTPERAAFVESACSFAQPTATLEIGMAWGMSTLGILSTLSESARSFHPHVVIDPWQAARYREAALLGLRRAGAETLVEFHPKASVAVLPKLSGRTFDFVFVDGAHHYSAVFCDLWLLHPLLRPGSVVVVDDVWFDDIQRACKFAEKNLGYRVHSEYPSGGAHPLLRAYVVEPVVRDDLRFGGKFKRARSRLLTRYRRGLMLHALRRLGLMRPETHPKVANRR